MAAEWANKYLDVPFRERGRGRDGVDCWGLVRLVLGEQYDLEVPAYDDEYVTTSDNERLAGIVERERGGWAAISPEDVQPGDVVLLAIAGFPCHVGIVVGDGLMLNARQGVGVALESYERPYWNRRLRGFYRHSGMWVWTTTGAPVFEYSEPEPCFG